MKWHYRRWKGCNIDVEVSCAHLRSCYGATCGAMAYASFMNKCKPKGATYELLDVGEAHSIIRDELVLASNAFELERLNTAESNVLTRLEKAFKNVKLNCGGVLVDPILVPNGVMFHRGSFLRQIRELCDRYGRLMFCDEMGSFVRCGAIAAHLLYGFTPDYFVIERSNDLCDGAMYSDSIYLFNRRHSRVF